MGNLVSKVCSSNFCGREFSLQTVLMLVDQLRIRVTSLVWGFSFRAVISDDSKPKRSARTISFEKPGYAATVVVRLKRTAIILDNIGQHVNSVQGTFESVIKAWQDSLTVFEALANGVSQKAKSGEILLALSAWHLYPDLMIVEPFPKTVAQKDSLIQSCGILTVGLHRVGEEQEGIRWSLPLAQLRHYGAPVTRNRTVNSTQRLTLDENQRSRRFKVIF